MTCNGGNCTTGAHRSPCVHADDVEAFDGPRGRDAGQAEAQVEIDRLRAALAAANADRQSRTRAEGRPIKRKACLRHRHAAARLAHVACAVLAIISGMCGSYALAIAITTGGWVSLAAAVAAVVFISTVVAIVAATQEGPPTQDK